MVLSFKLADDVVSSLKNVLLSRGFVEFIDHYHANNSWNFQWKTTRYSDIDSIGPESTSSASDGLIQHRQKINHFQKTSGICKKDTLARNLRRMLKTWGTIYGYAPQTFILPRELKELEAEMKRCEMEESKEGPVVWICKPSSSSQGKNIFLITKLAQLAFDQSFVIQRYIADPMLIGGYKYDLRIYVLVTSFRPLCVYMYREGLARFSSQKYDPSDMNNLFSHLTNASINKASPDLLTEKDVIGSGCKWTMKRWFEYLESVGQNPYNIWEKIKDIAILTLLPIVSEVPDNTRCFELFGFDIMLDSKFKPWIIEVNASPAIAISGLQDTTVKIPLLNDLMTAIGFPKDESLAQTGITDNILPSNHPHYDPQAQSRAAAAAVAAYHAAQLEAAQQQACAAGDVDSNPSASPTNSPPSGGVVLNQANRGDKIQRVPRLVKMQTQKGRESLAAAAASATSSSSSSSSSAPRRSSTVKPAVPMQSPTRPLPNIGASPSKIPILKSPTNASSSATTTTTNLKPKRLVASADAKLARTAAIKRTSTTITTPASRTAIAPLSTSVAAPPPAAANRAKSRPIAGGSDSNPPTTLAASTSLAPDLIGDFERIFPFDSVTASASDSIATASVLKAKASQPLPVLFSNFTKTAIQSLKGRIKAREKIVAERKKTKAQPLRFPFAPTSTLPSPWSSEAIEAAVNAAKQAAKDERARLGIPEPQKEEEEKQQLLMKVDESVGVEQAIAALQLTARSGTASSSSSSSQLAQPDEDEKAAEGDEAKFEKSAVDGEAEAKENELEKE